MVGFVLGLGDRHGENILFDSNNGDTVHVDFNCIFEKGHTFDVPEKVPFRLTQNVVDGFGVTGVEGVFRRACEVTMRILRENKDSLMSVLESFVHDPLVEWLPSKNRGKTINGVEEHMEMEARNVLRPIKDKLLGLRFTDATPAQPGQRAVSTEVQVESLIREATSSKNLGSMYVGWTAHL